ncbi:MAG: redoxin domain-containing protein [Acidobacteriaceae bacterium]|nr:redoxin domain-containing protein [Acidobacteriaceae bacterium]
MLTLCLAICAAALSFPIRGAQIAGGADGDGVLDLKGKPVDLFASPAAVQVLLFVRTDCPITNRYAPELQRLHSEFASRKVNFWLVYADPAETAAGIEAHVAGYRFPGVPVRDPHHMLVKRAHATTAPEAAVFDAAGTLRYHGRIDDRYVDIGKARAQADIHDLENAILAVLAGKAVAEPETRAIGCSLADVE